MKAFNKLLSITLYLFLSSQDALNAQGDCVNTFKPVIHHLKAKTNREYLEKLKLVYESKSQMELDRRAKVSGKIKLPGYGSADFGKNKRRIYTIYDDHKGQRDFDFSYQEQMDLISTYIPSETASIDAWQNSASETYRIPRIHLVAHSKDSVVVKFKMNSNALDSAPGKVKVITISGFNLKLAGSTIPGDSIMIRDTIYILEFARLSPDVALVSIGLSNGVTHSKHIPAIVSAPMYETQKEYGTLDFEIESNIYPGWLKVRNPDATLQTIIEFPDEDNDYHINFKVKTGLSDADTKITSCQFINEAGAIRTQNQVGQIIEPDGTLSLAYYIVTGHTPVTGKLKVLYTTSKKVCVANCR